MNAHLSRQAAHHASGVPVKVLEQAIVIPGRHTPEGRVLVQQNGRRSKHVQKVRAELHVVLADDGMAVAPLGLKKPLQAPFVVL